MIEVPGHGGPPSLSPQPDVVPLLEGLTELVEHATAGEGGLPGLQLTAELAQAATGAVGATFMEYGRSGGRVVVTTAELGWSLGRPVDITDPAVARVLAGPPVQDLPIDGISDEARRNLRGRGVRRIVRAMAAADGELIGSLQVYLREPAPAGPYERAVVRVLASCAAHLYRDGGGLPVYPDGPALTPLTQGMAVVGPDAVVRSWSPSAARLTGRPFEDAIGRPLPFPVPSAGQVAVHWLDPMRWLRVRSTALTGTDATVVTFQETGGPEPGEQARDLFIAVTSHELRTPVTVIRGYADTLVEHWDSLSEKERREVAFVLGQRSRGLARLVDRLLSATSDATGLLGAASGVPFDLIEALRDAAAELTSDLRRDLRLDLPAPLPKAHGSRAGLATVLTELVTNAAKYSPDQVDIEVTAGADTRTVWFRVADRGAGIRPEHVERAFERFWQFDRSDQRRSGGVGLGLYLVRQIVERQNGWVSLRPRDGGGTVAEVRLPRADECAGEAQGAADQD